MTLRIFADIEVELAGVVGTDRIEEVREVLTEVLQRVVLPDGTS